jgi:hypothetical protein
MHRYAKEVVAKWLRVKIKKGWNSIQNIKLPEDLSDLKVFEEYPICLKGKEVVGVKNPNEKTTKNPFICDIWKNEFETLKKRPIKKSCVPISKDIKTAGLKMIHVFDVAVTDHKKLVAVIEIMHKHKMTQKKINFVKKHGIPTYEVSAQWVMEQCTIPAKVEVLQEFIQD